MSLNIAREVAALNRMTVTELRARHIEVFGEATRSGNKDWLVKRIAWRIQANAEGGLTDRLSRSLIDFARIMDVLERNKVAFVSLSRELVDGQEVGGACALFDPLWETLSACEQARILHLLIERVTYDGPGGSVAITFHPTGIKALADELATQEATA